MTRSTRAIVAVTAVAAIYFAGRAAEWAARTWGLERVVVVLSLAVVGLVLGLVVACEVRDRRERRAITGPWVAPWHWEMWR